MSWQRDAAGELRCDHDDTVEISTARDYAFQKRRWCCPDCGWTWTVGAVYWARLVEWQRQGAEPDVVVVAGDDQIPF